MIQRISTYFVCTADLHGLGFRLEFRSSEREMPFVTLCSETGSLYSKGTKGVILLFESFKDRAMKMPRLGEYPVQTRLQQKR